MERKSERLPIFTERFRELQGKQSNTEFAEFLGISRQTVGFYCNGDRVPDALTLVKIAKKCEVSADWLLGLSDERSINGDLAQAARYTGLPANSVNTLHKLTTTTEPLKASLCVINEILGENRADFETWVWRASMSSCCPIITLDDKKFSAIRRSADSKLMEAAKNGIEGATVDTPIFDYETVCTSTAMNIIQKAVETALAKYKAEFKRMFLNEISNKS